MILGRHISQSDQLKVVVVRQSLEDYYRRANAIAESPWYKVKAKGTMSEMNHPTFYQNEKAVQGDTNPNPDPKPKPEPEAEAESNPYLSKESRPNLASIHKWLPSPMLVPHLPSCSSLLGGTRHSRPGTTIILHSSRSHITPQAHSKNPCLSIRGLATLASRQGRGACALGFRTLS